MTLKCRNFLLFLGAAAGSLPTGEIAKSQNFSVMGSKRAITARSQMENAVVSLNFQPVKLPLPLNRDYSEEQIAAYASSL